jgi:hypothetical protein
MQVVALLTLGDPAFSRRGRPEGFVDWGSRAYFGNSANFSGHRFGSFGSLCSDPTPDLGNSQFQLRSGDIRVGRQTADCAPRGRPARVSLSGGGCHGRLTQNAAVSAVACIALRACGGSGRDGGGGRPIVRSCSILGTYLTLAVFVPRTLS